MESIWTRTRPSAPAKETLTRQQIVQAALEMLDTDGLAGLSMRKLAAKLGSGATSLYWHVETKDDLIDLIIDQIYAEIDVPEPELAGWRGGATLFGHSIRATVLRHPWLPEVIHTRPSLGPNAMSLGSRGLVLFGAAGFTGRKVDYAMGAVMAYVLGSVSAEVGVRAAVEKTGQSMEDWTKQVVELAAANAGDKTPMDESLRWRSAADVSALHNEHFAFGLDAVLDGLEAQLKKN